MTEADLNNLNGQFCVGRNRSVDLSTREFFIMDRNKEKFTKMRNKFKQRMMTKLAGSDPENVETIDGGPSCFGDSGKGNSSGLYSQFLVVQ